MSARRKGFPERRSSNGFPLNSRLDQIRRTETLLGVAFPSGFVERMLVSNGGDVAIGEEVWSVCEVDEIARETEGARRWPNFPPAGVAVASNGRGDQLVLLPEPIQRQVLQEAVFMWSHENGDLDKVTDNFAELGNNPHGVANPSR